MKHEHVICTLPETIMDDPAWSTRVAQKLAKLEFDNDVEENALQRVVMLKGAIREVTMEMGQNLFRYKGVLAVAGPGAALRASGRGPFWRRWLVRGGGG